MVRLEREGDAFVLVTGTSQKKDINVLINALLEAQKDHPDSDTIIEGVSYLDNSAGVDLRKEIRTVLQKAMENKDLTIKDL